MPPTRRSEFDAFCHEAFGLLDREGVRYIIVGGLAVIALGEPRMTGDVDVIAFLSDEEAQGLVAAADGSGFEADADTEHRRLRETGTLRFRQGPHQLDVITASLPFEEVAYQRSTTEHLFGHKVRFPSPEDLILFKVLAGRDKDILDAVGIARRHAGRLDRRYLEDTLQPICDLAEDLTAWRHLQDVLHKGER